MGEIETLSGGPDRMARFALLRCGVLGINPYARPRSTEPAITPGFAVLSPVPISDEVCPM